MVMGGYKNEGGNVDFGVIVHKSQQMRSENTEASFCLDEL